MKKEWIIIFIGVSIMFSIVYVVFYGTPWGKYIMKKKAQVYLDNKYEQNMIIKSGWYNFKEDNYYFDAYPKGNENQVFIVRNIDNDTFGDFYFIRLWTDEVNTELKSFAKNLYGDDATIGININENPIKYKPKSKIPSYSDIKDQLDYSSIYLFVDRSFDSNNTDTEYAKLFEVLQFIKDKKYFISEIRIYYKPNSNLLDKRFVIDNEQLQSITSKEDIIKYKDDFPN